MTAIRGIGPGGSSLLHKTGRKLAYEMSDDELHALVAKEQERRTIQRAVGRLQKMVKEDAAGARRTVKAQRLPQTLEDLGLSPVTCVAIRLKNSGKTDAELIALLKQKGF